MKTAGIRNLMLLGQCIQAFTKIAKTRIATFWSISRGTPKHKLSSGEDLNFVESC